MQEDAAEARLKRAAALLTQMGAEDDGSAAHRPGFILRCCRCEPPL